MLKKKSGGFKPKAPVRRNAPAAPSKGRERSATTERQSTTPAAAPAPAPAPAPVPAPPTSSEQLTPTPSLSQSLTPDAPPPSIQATESHHEAISTSSTVPSSKAVTSPSQPQHVRNERTIEQGGIAEPPPVAEPNVTKAGGEGQAEAAQKTSPIPTQSTEVSAQRDAALGTAALNPTAPAAPSSESTATTTTPPAAAAAESNIDPALRSVTSIASTRLPTDPAISSTADQPNPTPPERPAQATAQPAVQAATPPTETITNHPQASIEATGDPVNTEPSTAPKPKPGRKRKSASEAAGEGTAPKKRVRKKKAATDTEGQKSQVGQTSGPAVPRRRARKSKGPAAEQAGNEVGENGDDGQQAQRTPRHRSVTPEDAEEIEVDMSQVKMGDLIKDMRIGKKFSRHDELLERERAKRQKNYVAKKLKENGLDSVANSNEGTPAGSKAATPAPDQNEAPAAAPKEDQPAVAAAPQLQIINGQIVLNSNSLQFDRHAHAVERAGVMEEEIEDEFTHHTTSSSYMKRPMKSNNWTPAETEKFYLALRMIGTDFQIISKMFPGKNRRHIKLKFNREERLRPQRINAALVGKKTVAMDLDEYKSHTGEEYETVDAITAEHRRAEEEFEAEERRIDGIAADEAKRKRDELFGGNDDEEGLEGKAAAKRGGGRGRSKKVSPAGLGA